MNSEKGKKFLFAIVGALLGLVIFLYFAPNVEHIKSYDTTFNNEEDIDNNDDYDSWYDKEDQDEDDDETPSKNSYHRYKAENIVSVGKSEPNRYATIKAKEPDQDLEVMDGDNQIDYGGSSNGGGNNKPNVPSPTPGPTRPNPTPTPTPSPKPNLKPNPGNNGSNSGSNNNANGNSNGGNNNGGNEEVITPEDTVKGYVAGYDIKTKKETKVNVTGIENQLQESSHLPVDSSFYSVSSKFGWRNDPFTQKRDFHLGLDISSKGILGKEVFAMTDGLVAYTNLGGDKTNYGNVVVLKHGEFDTVYAHLEGFARNIKPGTPIKAGDVIGYVGSTGRSTGPHLHIEYDIKGVKVNPEHFIKIINGDEGILNGNSLNEIDFNSYKNKYGY